MFMKKYLYSVLVMALFAIGFAASDENENDKKTVVVENVDSLASEDEDVSKRTYEPLSTKEKEVAEAGSNQGTLFGMAGVNNESFSNIHDAADNMGELGDKYNEVLEEIAGKEYDKVYNSPTNTEEEKLKKIYIEYFIEAFNNTMDVMGN